METVLAVWFPHNGATVVAVRLDLIAHYSFACRFPLLRESNKSVKGIYSLLESRKYLCNDK